MKQIKFGYTAVAAPAAGGCSLCDDTLTQLIVSQAHLYVVLCVHKLHLSHYMIERPTEVEATCSSLDLKGINKQISPNKSSGRGVIKSAIHLINEQLKAQELVNAQSLQLLNIYCHIPLGELFPEMDYKQLVAYR